MDRPLKDPHDVRRRELAAIHAARWALGLDEDTYRDLLEAWTGKRSAALLTDEERQFVIECFRRLGFSRRTDEVQVEPDDPEQTKLIKNLWLRLYRLRQVRNPSLAALNAFVRRMTGISHVRWLPPHEANIVIEALKSWLQRSSQHT